MMDLNMFLQKYWILILAGDCLTSFFVLTCYIFAVLNEKIRWKKLLQYVLVSGLPMTVTLYVENLEMMHKEMRTFRHDYKNILSSMSLYASEGEMEKLQDILRNLEIDFDRKMGEKIRTTTEIGNIQIPEVKSLVLTKISKMNELKISNRLEVLYPLTETGMDIWDFCRCLGILLDNAIEAAAGVEENRNIELLLTQQNKFLSVRVANSWDNSQESAKLLTEGYSTKGKNRGIGLSSYQQMLNKYPNVSQSTRWDDRIFVQELTIGV